MDTFFIDQTILEFLDGSFASIHKNRDLVMRDMPLLESKLALVNSALAEQKAVCTQDQQSEILVDKQECDVRPTDQEAVATSQTNNMGKKSRNALDSSTLANVSKSHGQTTKDLLTEEEAADYLKVHRVSLKRWRLAQKGPRYVDLGPRQKRYEQIDLDNFADQLKKGGLDAKTA
jgi:hypothetical protein